MDAVLRFDNEIANIAQGISSASFGIPSAAWGALRVVLHVSIIYEETSTTTNAALGQSRHL